MRRPAKILVTLTAVVALLSGCGDDGGSSQSQSTAASAAEDGSFPVTVSTSEGEVTVEAQPERIVSLSPTATEILYAVEAGDQVVAVDEQSNYPEEAPTTDLSGLEPNVEALLEYEPDLVVLESNNEEIATALGELEIPLLIQPAAATFDDVYEQVEVTGTVTGNTEAGETLADEMEAEITDLAEQAPTTGTPLTYYHELDDTFFTATSSTFIGEVYGAAGLDNIADEADDGSGFPQLSAEYIIDADPDLVFLADTLCCGQTPETVAARPGWNTMRAVQDGAVIPLNDDVASRWGPRVVEFLEDVVDAVEQTTA